MMAMVMAIIINDNNHIAKFVGPGFVLMSSLLISRQNVAVELV